MREGGKRDEARMGLWASGTISARLSLHVMVRGGLRYTDRRLPGPRGRNEFHWQLRGIELFVGQKSPEAGATE